MAGNRTIARLQAPTGNALRNPFFRNMFLSDVDDATRVPFFDATSPGALSQRTPHYALLATPGWYSFGKYPTTEFQLCTEGGAAEDAARTAHPFRSYDDKASHDAGLVVTQRSKYGAGAEVGGVCQKLRYGKALIGKKVRVSGAYYVTDDDSANVEVGMSIWLKGEVKSMTVSTGVRRQATDGVTSSTYTLDSVVALPDFDAAPVMAAGDLVIVSGQTTGATVAAGLYQVDSVTDADTLVIDDIQDDTDWPDTSSGLSCAFGADADNAAGGVTLGNKGFQLSRTTDVVSHVIRLTVDGNAYNAGHELLHRYTDFLQHPDVDSAAIAADALMFGKYQASGVLATHDIWVSGAADDFKLFFLDDTFSDDSINDMELITNTSTLASAAVHYFEEIVEIPDTIVPTYDDLWLVIMPVDPADLASMAGGEAKVFWYGLTIEVIPDPASDGNGAEDRMAKSLMSEFAGNDVLSPTNLRDMYQYPVLAPAMIPLPVAPATPSDSSEDHNTDTYLQGAPSRVDLTTITGGSFTTTWHVKQERLPPGSHVIDASIYIEEFVDDAANDAFTVTLVQEQAIWTLDSADSARQPIGSLHNADISAVTTSEYALTMFRHRVGLWNENGGDPLTVSGQTAASLWLDITLNGNASGFTASLVGGYMIALVDPRLEHSYWRTS